jgi:predicted 3-demethylubiquinone-9 3-methyltransferase (glyoxalase superfamily)
MPRITTFLTYESRAEEAAQLYVDIFPNSKVVKTVRYGAAGPGPKGGVMTVVFQLDGQEYVALNGGPHFQFTDAISLSIACKTQEEVDHFSERLTAGGGEQGPCGWVRDKFGVSWQVNPTILGELLGDPDPAKSRRVMEAMLQMKKIDIDALKRAAAGT